jgi:hypothetical protein
MLNAVGVLAAFAWDPQVRGFLIVLTGFTILVGSIYLLLATNTGGRLGFLIAAAGLSGWCALMGWIWVVYGIGIKGPEPHWVVKEVVMGDVRANSALPATKEFPQGWRKLPEGDPVLGDASATADKVLVEQTAAPAHGAAATTPTINVQPMFKDATEYLVVGGYDEGGDDYFLPGGHLVRNKGFFQGWLHTPHHAVIQVKPVLPVPAIGGAPPEPTPDPAAPPVNVVMIRDLGRLRQPSALFAFAFSVAFAVVTLTLHRRDKEAMAARAGTATAPATG